MEKKEYKAGSVEAAIELALKELDLTIEQAEIEVVSNGGIFRKAVILVGKKEEENVVLEEESKEATTQEVKKERIAPNNVFVEKKSDGEGKEFIENILKLMNIACIVEERQRGGEISFYIKGEDAFKIIGYRGENLDALQHLVTYKLNKDKRNYERVVVDADFYRQKREQTLTNLAKKLAKRAATTGTEVELEPMNAFERRIIHSALQGSKMATTKSEGEGRQRHIVISPLENVEGTSAVLENIEYGTTSFSKTGPKRTKSYGYNKKKF